MAQLDCFLSARKKPHDRPNGFANWSAIICLATSTMNEHVGGAMARDDKRLHMAVGLKVIRTHR